MWWLHSSVKRPRWNSQHSCGVGRTRCNHRIGPCPVHFSWVDNPEICGRDCPRWDEWSNFSGAAFGAGSIGSWNWYELIAYVPGWPPEASHNIVWNVPSLDLHLVYEHDLHNTGQGAITPSRDSIYSIDCHTSTNTQLCWGGKMLGNTLSCPGPAVFLIIATDQGVAASLAFPDF
jgi:hypothetical protein